MSKQLEAVKEHVRVCPLGWHDGVVRAHRSTTDSDVILWLARLWELVGLDQPANEDHP